MWLTCFFSILIILKIALQYIIFFLFEFYILDHFLFHPFTLMFLSEEAWALHHNPSTWRTRSLFSSLLFFGILSEIQKFLSFSFPLRNFSIPIFTHTHTHTTKESFSALKPQAFSLFQSSYYHYYYCYIHFFGRSSQD